MNCPLCQNELIQKDMSCCELCGGVETDPKRKFYFKCDFLGHDVVLCDFCHADIDSMDQEFLGLPRDFPNEYIKASVQITASPNSIQLYCPECELQAKFLKIIKGVRENAAS